jgi:glycosyltransferase involved in cell wall biosynthesis
MAEGVPVVAGRTAALVEVLDDGARLVTPGDADGLAQALVELETGTARDDLVTRGRARVGQFSWEACGAGLSALYHRAAER